MIEHSRPPRRLPVLWVVTIGFLLTPLPVFGQLRDSIAVVNRKALADDKIGCERIALGEDDDYKPDLIVLPNGELILIAFHQYKKEGGKVLEQNLLFRSHDGGRTKPEKLDQLGREPYFSVLQDGTLFMTGHLLANDVRNKYGYTHGYLHRSTDAGKSWDSIRITSEGVKPKASNHSTRNVLQLKDGTLLLGIDYDGGDGPFLLWRSKDNGKTWDKTSKCQPKDFKSQYGFFGGETWLWQAKSGKIWALVRVDSNELPIKDRPIKAGNDQADHFMLFSSADEGKTFDRIRDFGDYGEMYMSILRLQDKRLLLTFTVRDLKPPLGVRAIAGNEWTMASSSTLRTIGSCSMRARRSANPRAAASDRPCSSKMARSSRRTPTVARTTRPTSKWCGGICPQCLLSRFPSSMPG
ncbi:MAG: exo-alpha-sialidase [Planctomycetes bacterium]|nr:exo-alpha-sialidase [Planctomycetota bacterium]